MKTPLVRTLHVARARMAWQRALRASSRAILISLGLGFAVQVLTLVFPLEIRLLWIYGGAGAVGLVFLLGSRAALSPSLYEAAHLLDRSLRLEDRLTTALAVEVGAVRSALGEAVVADAARVATGVDVRKAISLLQGVDRRLLPLALVVLLWDSLISGITLPGTPARRVAEVIRSEGRRLERVAAEAEARPKALRIGHLAEAARLVREAARALQQPRVTRAQADARLEEVLQRLQEVRRRLEELAQGGAGGGVVQEQVQRAERVVRQLRSAAPQQLARLEEALRGLLRSGLPTPLRSQLREAEEALHAGKLAEAHAALERIEQELRRLDRMALEAERLEELHREVQRAKERIRSAGIPRELMEREPTGGFVPFIPGGSKDPEGPGRESEVYRTGSGTGLQAGSGTVTEKLGFPTERLEARHRRERIEGVEEGAHAEVVEIRGPGVHGAPQAAPVRVAPVVVRRAEEAVARLRVPAPYREVVRRYFLELARRRE